MRKPTTRRHEQTFRSNSVGTPVRATARASKPMPVTSSIRLEDVNLKWLLSISAAQGLTPRSPAFQTIA
jgi:hypothetical protein